MRKLKVYHTEAISKKERYEQNKAKNQKGKIDASYD